MDKDKFEQLVGEYFQAESNYIDAQNNLGIVEDRRPMAPTVVQSVDEWNEFESQFLAWQTALQSWKRQESEYQTLYKAAEAALVNFLPRQVWFRYDDLAIGSAYYDWSGSHYSIVVEQWSDHLSSLDRRHRGD